MKYWLFHSWAKDFLATVFLGRRHLGQRHFGQRRFGQNDVSAKVTFRPNFFSNFFHCYPIFPKNQTKSFWPKRHFYGILDQNVTFAEMSLAKLSLSQMSLAQKYSGQNIFGSNVKQLKKRPNNINFLRYGDCCRSGKESCRVGFAYGYNAETQPPKGI